MTEKTTQIAPKDTIKIEIFDVSKYLPVYRDLPLETVIEQFRKTLQNAVKSSEDSTGALFGTVRLADGREARVQVSIEAAYIKQPVSPDYQ